MCDQLLIILYCLSSLPRDLGNSPASSSLAQYVTAYFCTNLNNKFTKVSPEWTSLLQKEFLNHDYCYFSDYFHYSIYLVPFMQKIA